MLATFGLRTSLDCSATGLGACALRFAGKPVHVIEAAVQHAVTAHGREDSSDLRAAFRAALRIEILTPLG